MLYPIKIIDIELSRPLITLNGLDGYIEIQGLVRLHGVPLGYIKAPITSGRCTAQTLSKLILEQHSWKIINHLLQNGLAAPPQPEGLNLEELFDIRPPEYDGDWPLVTVAVCSRDRTSDLALCLDALTRLDYPNLDILIVDNAPTSDATKELVKQQYPQFRYVCEPCPGLDWARNRAIHEAKGEIIAYTDDDVIVDPLWVKALAKVFAENPQVMALTGLVVPYELETEAQVLFEMYGGFGRGFERKWYQSNPDSRQPVATRYGCAGLFGTGANMAYRRCVFDQIGLFDPALDVGTVTNGGGDIEMFFRVSKEGYSLVYEPCAIVRHRHRRDYAKLHAQITNNGIGLYAFWIRSAIAYPDERLAFMRLGIWWLWWWLIRRLLISLIHPFRFKRALIVAELRGCFIGLTRYQKARQIAKTIAQSTGQTLQDFIAHPATSVLIPEDPKIAIRTVELSQPLQPLTDLDTYSVVRVFLKWKDWPVGSIDLFNNGQMISKSRLIDDIVAKLGILLLEPEQTISQDMRWNQAMYALKARYFPSQEQSNTLERLPEQILVSVVIATYDRPEDLDNCLHHILKQETTRPLEIIVVDNHPASGLTSPVVAKFPSVILIQEARKGLSYARNAGIVASSGEIIVATDDDVSVPQDWLEKLVAPFARPDVMVVTGNVLPLKLETESQQFFEDYGGLGRGFESFEVNGDWFESFVRKAVPTWTLGATANAAFRSEIFSNPKIGLMKEFLGPGMPSGVGEDTYVFYKVLKAGYTLRYEADAYVWHKHRSDLESLRRQLYNYSKGGPAYHLTTWLDQGDWRGIMRILLEIPDIFIWRIKARLRRWNDYPWSLIWLEFVGYLVGPWALWRSHQRVGREGRSEPYSSLSQRSNQPLKQPSEIDKTVDLQQV